MRTKWEFFENKEHKYYGNVNEQCKDCLLINLFEKCVNKSKTLVSIYFDFFWFVRRRNTVLRVVCDLNKLFVCFWFGVCTSGALLLIDCIYIYLCGRRL